MENKFKRDLIVGQNSERRVGDIFLSKGYAVEYNNSKIRESLMPKLDESLVF